jgi:hypothetical protein
MSAYTDNSENYLCICELFGEEVKYIEEPNRPKRFDVYGAHAIELMARFKKERPDMEKQ